MSLKKKTVIYMLYTEHLQKIFGLVPLGVRHWLIMIALSVSPLVYVEIMKALGRFKTI